MRAALLRRGAPRRERTAGQTRMGLFGVLVLALRPLLASGCQEDFPGSTHCPSDNFSIPEGSSGMTIANISKNATLVLCHKNSSSSHWEDILSISTKGDMDVFIGAYEEHFSVSANALVIKNASKWLAGGYQLADLLHRSCVQLFILSMPEPWHCPSAYVSMPEGSSETIVDNILINSNKLALYRKNHSSSAWQHILNITKGHLNYSISAYEGYFHISNNNLVIKNAYEGLPGEY
ncbi:uncharacterized protein LOC133382404 [Rhineura floridana]|uniref:uncharacterized protein LOC133382404 n=1 Tax=Rhineura floridana TaxID=261503 RepID=UPI002AC86696|nr:uncharacterized protein LOC133382404 [Rhineura floridana]